VLLPFRERGEVVLAVDAESAERGGGFLAESVKNAERRDPVGVCPVALAFLVGSVLSGERRAS